MRKCGSSLAGAGELEEVARSRGLRTIRRIPVRGAGALAIGGGAIWIADFATGVITRVDPSTGASTASVHLALPAPVAPGDRRFLPSAISVGGGRVWVSTARGWMAVIDARTSRLEAMVRSPSEETATTVQRHDVWVAEGLGGIGKLAPGRTRLAVRALSYHGQPVDIYEVAAGGGVVWALGSYLPVAAPGERDAGVVMTIAPRTGAIARAVALRAPRGRWSMETAISISETSGTAG